MKAIRLRFRLAACGVTLLAMTDFAAAVPGAVATRRLGTGLPATAEPGELPEAWVAPADSPPKLDGHLDETVWGTTRGATLGKLEIAAEASPGGRARFLHHGGVLYVGVELEEPNVGNLKRQCRQTDGPAWEDDSIELFLSPDPSAGYYQVVASASGAIFDRKGRGDPATFNSGAKVVVAVGKQGWSMEMAIPMASLGVGKQVPARWRGNVYRNRHAGTEGQNQAWSPTLRPDYDVPERFGHLLFTPEPPWAGEKQGAVEPGGIRIEPVPGGGAVLLFDLSGFPKAARVYRARLLCDRMPLEPGDPRLLAPIEIYPLVAAFEQGRTPKTDPKPLELVGPWFRSFEISRLVGEWLSGRRPNHGLCVKTLPGWRKEKTYLDVMYEGEPGEVPPQASGVKIFHRAGQTFITFREVEPPVSSSQTTWGEIKQALATAKDAVSYRVYAHDRPIDAGSIAQAELLAEVGPLSGYNTSGRNLEYLICQAMLEPDEMGELCRDYGGYMYSWHMDHPRMDRYPAARFVVEEGRGPLPEGTGLYVHSPGRAGRRYYAVVSCRNGVENTLRFSAANAPPQPVAETVGTGVPVRQGEGLWGPYFDYPGRRQVYVQWCAPPLAPKPNMAFNWSVLVPPGANAQRKAPVELYFHSGNFSYAKPRQKYIRDSIQIAPHDYPFSGWYGFNDAWGTLKSWQHGVVSNHTQQRLIVFLEWAKGEFPLDAGRIVLCGSDGAAALAMNFREMFAYALIAGFGGAGKVQGRVLNPDEADRFASAWGPKSPLIKDGQGRADWAWAMLDLLAMERPEQPMPLIVCAGTSWGGVRQYGKAFGPYYTNMQEARQPLIAGHGWNCKLITPDWYTGSWQSRPYMEAPGLDVTRTTPIPAFANSSRSVENLQSGNVNWMHHWEDARDEPGQFQITLHGAGTVDLTPRRLQKFKLRPGERVRYETEPLPSQRDKEPPTPQSGSLVVDAHGLVTVNRLRIPDGGVIVRITRGQ